MFNGGALGGWALHDYVKGAFEALSWVRLLLLDLQHKPEEAVKEALKEIDAALDDIKTGVACDFRWRLRAH
ncbi:MAG: hypothetical protein QW160_04520 [Candidatus Bathyarchaeia archaeon]